MFLGLRLSYLFLFLFVFFEPLYKYCEYVLHFPRVNVSLLYLSILLAIYLINIYNFNKFKFNKISLSICLLILVSLIQIITFPWASSYSNNGVNLYLTTISNTIVKYWLFWFLGNHIKDILLNKKFWYAMSYLWIFLVVLIISNALRNDIFGIILDGTGIYLMLADSFAIFSIFMFCHYSKKKYQLLIVIVSTICLLALFSRASLYCFILTSFILLFKTNRTFLYVFLLCLTSTLYFGLNQEIIEDRMFRIIFGGNDASYNMRAEDLSRGLEDLRSDWILGSFMGDVENNFGKSGEYIHNYISFWRQFGILPFVVFISTLIYYFGLITKVWFASSGKNKHINILFYFSVFSILEIISSRSFVYPYIWFSIGGIATYLKYYQIAERKYE